MHDKVFYHLHMLFLCENLIVHLFVTKFLVGKKQNKRRQEFTLGIKNF